MQTQGKDGVGILKRRVKAYGVGTLWAGAWATAAASFVGSYPCKPDQGRDNRADISVQGSRPITFCKKSCRQRIIWSGGWLDKLSLAFAPV